MTKMKLDKEEQDILNAYESGAFQSVMTKERKKLIQSIAENSFKKDKRINIRLSGRDLSAIQKRALEEGIPYQTLVSSILHKYISGSLCDITATANKAHSHGHR
jgi:predicted DNA binding CopG/RHH family protein